MPRINDMDVFSALKDACLFHKINKNKPFSHSTNKDCLFVSFGQRTAFAQMNDVMCDVYSVYTTPEVETDRQGERERDGRE